MRPCGRKTSMLNEVYNDRILELAGNIPRLGRLPAPDASATAHSKLCGSTVTVDLKMDGPLVTDFAHDVKACALGQASSSIMARHVIGAKADELRQLRETVRKMLKENGPPPSGKWADIAVLEPGARLQGAPRLHHAHFRCGSLGHRQDRGQGETGGGIAAPISPPRRQFASPTILRGRRAVWRSARRGAASCPARRYCRRGCRSR